MFSLFPQHTTHAHHLLPHDSEVHLLWYDNKTKSFQPGTQQFAYIYRQGSKQLVFIESDANVTVLTQFNGRDYDLPPYSVSLVDESGTELYNTGKVLPARVRPYNTLSHTHSLSTLLRLQGSQYRLAPNLFSGECGGSHSPLNRLVSSHRCHGTSLGWWVKLGW